MNPTEFEKYLYMNIPITEKMGFKVIEFSPSLVKIKASFEPNVNHTKTAFGGSISSLATICGWAAAFASTHEYDPNSHLVIQKGSINYLLPMTNDFTAECRIEERRVERLIATYKKFGRARIDLQVDCKEGDKIGARFEGQYVIYR